MLRRPQFSLTKVSASHCYRLYAKYAEINQNVIDWQTKPWRCKGETLEHSQKMTHLTVQCCYETIWDAVRQKKKKKNGAASRWNLESWAPKIHKRADWNRPLQARGRPEKGCNALAIQQTRIKHAGLFISRKALFLYLSWRISFQDPKAEVREVPLSGVMWATVGWFSSTFPTFPEHAMTALLRHYLILNLLLRVVPLSAQAKQDIPYIDEKPKAQMDWLTHDYTIIQWWTGVEFSEFKPSSASQGHDRFA